PAARSPSRWFGGRRRALTRWLGGVLVVLLALTISAVGAGARTFPDGFTDQLVTGGFDLPVGMAFLPDGRLRVSEQKTGNVRVVVGNAIGSTDPIGTIPAINGNGPERGLLGIAVDPGWPVRPYVYVHATSTGSHIRISRFTVSGSLGSPTSGDLTLSASSRYDLIDDILDNADNHNGGTLRFGGDGRLYRTPRRGARGIRAAAPL